MSYITWHNSIVRDKVRYNGYVVYIPTS